MVQDFSLQRSDNTYKYKISPWIFTSSQSLCKWVIHDLLKPTTSWIIIPSNGKQLITTFFITPPNSRIHLFLMLFLLPPVAKPAKMFPSRISPAHLPYEIWGGSKTSSTKSLGKTSTRHNTRTVGWSVLGNFTQLLVLKNSIEPCFGLSKAYIGT